MVRVLLFAIACLWAEPALAFVINNFTVLNDNTGSGITTITGTISVTNTGDLVLLSAIGGCWGSAGTCNGTPSPAWDLSSATVGATSCTSVAHATGSNTYGIWIGKCENVAAGASQSVSVTFNQATNFPTVHVLDISGAKATNTSEGANNIGDGGVSSSSPQSITTGTIHAGDLVVSGINGPTPNQISVGACCTTATGSGSAPNSTEYQVANSTSAINSYSWTSGATPIDVVIAGFLPACRPGLSLMLTGVGC